METLKPGPEDHKTVDMSDPDYTPIPRGEYSKPAFDMNKVEAASEPTHIPVEQNNDESEVTVHIASA